MNGTAEALKEAVRRSLTYDGAEVRRYRVKPQLAIPTRQGPGPAAITRALDGERPGS